MFLAGIALLTPLGLAGAAVYVAGHALVKAALFLCTGIVLHRLRSVNETWLHGRGRRLRVTGVVFTLAALGLADLPPFATYLGQGWIEDSGGARGMAWVTVLLVAASVLVGGAVLRVAGGVFYGLGDPPSEDPQMAEESVRGDQRDRRGQAAHAAHHDHPARRAGRRGRGDRAAARSWVPVVEAAAVRFQDQPAYNATVLHGARVAHATAPYPAGPAGVTVTDLVIGLGTAAGRGSSSPSWPCTGGGCRCCAGASSRAPGWCGRSGGSRAAWSTTTSPGSCSAWPASAARWP